MITGFNTDVEYDGVIYHVQTEDKGLDSPLILSLVYVGGAILASKRSPYDDLIASGFNDTILYERLQRQHQLICAAIHAGRIEDLKRMGKREPEDRAAQQASQAEPQAPTIADHAPITREAVMDVPAPPAVSPPVDVPPVATPPPVTVPPPVALPPPTFISPVSPPPTLPGAGKANAAFKAVDGDVLHLSFLEERELRAGQFVMLRIRVSHGAGEDRDSVPDAPVTVKILGTTFRTLVSSARTDRDGIALVFAALPRFTSGRAALLVHTAIGGLTAEMRRIIQNA